jgi:hypothetical protein
VTADCQHVSIQNFTRPVRRDAWALDGSQRRSRSVRDGREVMMRVANAVVVWDNPLLQMELDANAPAI